MQSLNRFTTVYIKIEAMYGRAATTRDIESSYRRYLKIEGLEPKP